MRISVHRNILLFNNKKAQMSTIRMEDFDKIKQEYLDAIPEGDAMKLQLKTHNKEQKARHAIIYSYMRENDI